MKESEISRKVLSGLKWTAMLRILGQIINWGMSIIVIRYIRPEEYGLKSMAEITIGLLMMFSSGGMESSIIHVKELTKDKISKIFGLLIAINLLLFVLQIVGAYPLADYYKDTRITLLVQVMALGFLLVPFAAIPSALLSRDMDYRLLSSVSLITNIIGAVCTLIMALNGFGVWSLVSGPLLTSLLNAVIMNVYKPCLTLPMFSFDGISDMALFGGMLVLTSLLWLIFSRSDIFIAGRFLSAHEVGIYAVALHLASLPVDKIIPILNQVAFPAYAKLRDNPNAVSKYFLLAVRLTSLVLFPISFGLAGISYLLVPMILGNEWSDVAPLLLILCLVFPLRGISMLCAPMTNALGKPQIQLNLVIIASVLMVSGFYFGVKFGILGLVLVWAYIYPWIMLCNLWLSKNVIGLSLFSIIRAMASPLLMATVMIFGLLCFTSLDIVIINNWITIGVLVTTGAFIYIMGMYVISKPRLFELKDLVRR